MNLLIVAATPAEIQPLSAYLQQHWDRESHGYKKAGKHIRLCITGAGMLSTAYHLTRVIREERFSLAIQAGIAGSFVPELPVGAVAAVSRDTPADLGADTGSGFLHLTAMPFFEEQDIFDRCWLPCPLEQLPFSTALPRISAVTVNTVSGSAPAIAALRERYSPDIESMEGAAFHYVCLREKIPFLQLRSISNAVTVRDSSRWNIPLAITELNRYLNGLLEEL
ncbi:futalosine hydrolase [Compostibacter hankyongensis]|uniref:Futalosine hydrolase n=1 Tax=Compostibacter hankyongensis TaxID=1007089 RepID=A0ABP8FGV0_9BACT